MRIPRNPGPWRIVRYGPNDFGIDHVTILPNGKHFRQVFSDNGITKRQAISFVRYAMSQGAQ